MPRLRIRLGFCILARGSFAALAAENFSITAFQLVFAPKGKDQNAKTLDLRHGARTKIVAPPRRAAKGIPS